MPRTVSFFAFWLENVVRATAPYHFVGSERPKLPRDSSVLCILTWKCASRHSGVPFLDMWTSKIAPRLWCFLHFDLKMRFAPQWRTIFGHVNFENCSAIVVFWAFWLENALRATAACHFSFICGTATSAPAALARLPFEPHGKNTGIRDVPNIGRTWSFFLLTLRVRWSSFYWLYTRVDLLSADVTSLLCFSTLRTWHLYSAFQLCILSEVRLLNFLR